MGPMKTAIDVKSMPEFEELQTLVRQALSAAGGATADWERITTLSTGLLAQAKDFVVGGYYALAMYQSRKADGFLTGCSTYLDLIENDWQDATPPMERPKARERAISWWLERSVIAMRALAQSPAPVETITALMERCQRVDEFLKQKLDDEPTFAALIHALERFTLTAEPIPVALPAENPAATSSPAEVNVLSDTDARVALDRIETGARRLANYMQSRDISDPRGYRLNRLSCWFAIDDLPPSENGRTKIAPPDQTLRIRLENLSKEKQWPALLQFAEDSAFQSVFWLDLQRAACESLEAMGHSRAAEAVRAATGAFVMRLPGVENLRFSEGTPFADDETHAWLASFQSVATAPAAASDLEAEIARDMEPVKGLIKNHKYIEAAQAFQDRLKASASARERFLCRQAFAAMLARTSGGTWFAPQAEQIIQDIDDFRLEQFDPPLALKGFTVALRGYRARSDAASKKRAEELLQRIAQIDLAEFVRQGGAH
jgi:type VI secretion system protein VasJ